ncbi:MAG: SH3 domain-containing protein [Candidatus Acidiferrales bacterium]|jgi:hypothetical protein
MRKTLLGFAVVLVVCVAAYLRFHHSKGPIDVAYAGNREVTVWSTTAQVRESLATLNYGDRLDVLDRSQDQVQVRTAGGVTGWVSESDLLSSDLWQKTQDMESRAKTLPVEASGHTRAISNLHVEPGRDTPRIRQLNKAIPVDLFERRVVELPVASNAAGGSGAASESAAEEKPAEAKKEDWWFVRAHLADNATVSGWVLGRFIDLDVPAPLPDYASAAGMHIVAWFELNRVADATGGTKSQYLLAGTRGGEGQACDFTLMRVYTWGKDRQRYETAFVESDVCGKLPVTVTRAAGPNGDVTFTFEDSDDGTARTRTYHMHQTIVREVREPGSAPARRKHANG